MLPGIWLARPEHVRLLARGPEAAAAMGFSASRSGAQRIGGVAVITLGGLLSKNGGWFGSSTVDAKQQISSAAADPNISRLMVRIDSPGGFSAGTAELAEAVAVAAAAKPTFAFIEDLGASAAYWVASQATKVFTNATGIVGSIGTYLAVADFSGAAAKEGIKVHVVKAGEFKGAGTPGTQITEEQLAEWQRMVNDLNGHFLAGVARGRKLPMATVRKLADGRAHVGQAAKTLGLVDGIATYEQTFAALLGGTVTAGPAAGPSPRNRAMENEEAISQFEALVSQAKAANPDSHAAMKAAINQAGPELHAAYIAASRAQSDARRIERGGSILRR